MFNFDEHPYRLLALCLYSIVTIVAYISGVDLVKSDLLGGWLGILIIILGENASSLYKRFKSK